MRGLTAARIDDMPEQLAGVIVGVDIVVAVLDKDIGRPVSALEIGKAMQSVASSGIRMRVSPDPYGRRVRR